MTREEFEAAVAELAEEIPAHYLDGIAGIDVSPRTRPHPVYAHVYTLGECVPIVTGTDEVLSRVVLYHGSFRALAREQPSFDWRQEARETLLHELRHHLEWQADQEHLEAYDWAAEQNFARGEGQPYDPLFYQAGERVADNVYRVEEDVFIERLVRRVPAQSDVLWHGDHYRVPIPREPPPLYLTLDGLETEPSGDVVLVVRRKPRWRDLFGGRRSITERVVRVERLD